MPTISFKVTEDEARRIRQLAEREHISQSEFLRRRAAGSDVGGEIKTLRCRLTGATIFEAAPGNLPLTTEEVKQILSDFP